MLSTPDAVTLVENRIDEPPVSDSNAELPVGRLLLGSRQPCPTIDELRTVIEILFRLSTQPSNLTSMATKRGRPVVKAHAKDPP